MDTETLEDTSAWLKPESVQTPRRCSALTRQGKACGGYALKGGETCLAHSPEGEQARSKAVLASAEARRAVVIGRKEAKEAAKLGVIGWMERLAGEHDEALARAALTRALDGEPRMLNLFLERVYGKVTDHVSIEAGNPSDMPLDELVAWLSTAEGAGTESSTVTETKS